MDIGFFVVKFRQVTPHLTRKAVFVLTRVGLNYFLGLLHLNRLPNSFLHHAPRFFPSYVKFVPGSYLPSSLFFIVANFFWFFVLFDLEINGKIETCYFEV